MTIFKAAITALLILGFAALMIFLLSEVGVEQTHWERYVYLLSGVEAIVFAAVGWLFGKEVHRDQAAKAEAKVDDANKKADKATSDAAVAREKGANLARAILSHAETAPAKLQAVGVSAEPVAAEIAPLAKLAEASYPEVRGGLT